MTNAALRAVQIPTVPTLSAQPWSASRLAELIISPLCPFWCLKHEILALVFDRSSRSADSWANRGYGAWTVTIGKQGDAMRIQAVPPSRTVISLGLCCSSFYRFYEPSYPRHTAYLRAILIAICVQPLPSHGHSALDDVRHGVGISNRNAIHIRTWIPRLMTYRFSHLSSWIHALGRSLVRSIVCTITFLL